MSAALAFVVTVTENGLYAVLNEITGETDQSPQTLDEAMALADAMNNKLGEELFSSSEARPPNMRNAAERGLTVLDHYSPNLPAMILNDPRLTHEPVKLQFDMYLPKHQGDGRFYLFNVTKNKRHPSVANVDFDTALIQAYWLNEEGSLKGFTAPPSRIWSKFQTFETPGDATYFADYANGKTLRNFDYRISEDRMSVERSPVENAEVEVREDFPTDNVQINFLDVLRSKLSQGNALTDFEANYVRSSGLALAAPEGEGDEPELFDADEVEP